MGITGLIPFLEKASSKIHLKDLRGTTVAVDSYCWLHKGVFSCAEKIVRGEDTDQYVQFCLKYVQLLLSYDIKPILVFDGQHLPAKALTERRRRENRRESKRRAAELLRLGKTEEARSHMRRCVDVTHEMALRLIRECRSRNVDCIVAPYEADAQMAWLNKANVAQYIITEDSDLTLFGARNVIFKLDLSGNGLLVEAEKLYLAMGCRKERYNFDKFRRMCILSGCDYIDSLPGIGLAKACKFMLKTEQDNMWLALKKLPQYLNMKQLQVNDDYIENFLKAEATFKHMYIYNPLKRKMERLHALDDYQTDERYCSNAGMLLSDEEQALQLALGNLNPFTLKQLDSWHPDRDFGLAQAPPKHIKRSKHKSIWQGSFENRNAYKNDQMKEQPTSCALYFKKVDFISKTIDADISANVSEESSKPAEADIFVMYKNEAAEMCDEPELKRRRYDYDDDVTLLSPTKAARHNPFAKTTDTALASTAPICANSSLLKILSPRKLKHETQRQLTSGSGFKRSMFAATEAKVEIRSRFFADNVKLAQECKDSSPVLSQPRLSTADVSEEIENIERLSQQKAAQRALLYDSPSPEKPIRSKVTEDTANLVLSHTDSGIESINATENNDVDEADKTLPSPILTDTNVDCIELSDEDVEIQDCQKKNPNVTATATATTRRGAMPETKLKAFMCQKAPRMGLSRPKAKTNKKSKPDQQQTRLSMFGFQKRPTLK